MAYPRLFSAIARILIGQLLLVNLAIIPSFAPTSAPSPVIAGVGKFNESTIKFDVSDNSRDDLILNLFTSTWGLLGDRQGAAPFPPASPSCQTSNDCLSIIMPGRLDIIEPSPTDSASDMFARAAFVVENTQAYHFEFDSVEVESSFDPSNCRRYAVENTAVGICARNLGDTIVYGWSACPDELVTAGSCLSNTTWFLSPTLSVQLSAFSLHAKTVYSLANSSILSVLATSTPRSIHISAAGILDVLDFALQPPDSMTSVILLAIIGDIRDGSIRGLMNPAELNILRAAPVAIITQSSGPPVFNEHTIGYNAKEVFRIQIDPSSRSAFIVLSFLLLLWCSGVLAFCWTRDDMVPAISYFPEVDFTRNILAARRGIPFWLLNGSKEKIIDRIKGEKFYFGS
jgi:hypothetical protein